MRPEVLSTLGMMGFSFWIMLILKKVHINDQSLFRPLESRNDHSHKISMAKKRTVSSKDQVSELST
ncbi:hypothetical protein LguiB_001730 [Lonicera macranthoides]